MPDPKKVFVVHGRNHAARRAMFAFLRAIGLEPMEWGQAVSFTGQGSPYIGNVLEQAFAEAQAVVVLLTGDDVARLRPSYLTDHDPPHERALTPQARPNVLFEAGLAFGRHPERTILVALGQTRPFSDITGRYTILISNSVLSRQQLADRLKTAGCAVDIVGKTDWHGAGDFDACLQSLDKTTLKYPSRFVGPLIVFLTLLSVLGYVLFRYYITPPVLRNYWISMLYTGLPTGKARRAGCETALDERRLSRDNSKEQESFSHQRNT
jgi:hypothetical protein